jgi:hypothetical protein
MDKLQRQMTIWKAEPGHEVHCKNFYNPNFSKFPQVSIYLFKFIYISSHSKLMNCKTTMTKDNPIKFVLSVLVRIILLFGVGGVDIDHWKGPAASGVSTPTCTRKRLNFKTWP